MTFKHHILLQHNIVGLYGPSIIFLKDYEIPDDKENLPVTCRVADFKINIK